MNTRTYYRDGGELHWVNNDDLDTSIIQCAQQNVADLGLTPDTIGWDEYRRVLDQMVQAGIQSRLAVGESIRGEHE